MRKLPVVLALIALCALPGFSLSIGWEIGVSGTPIPNDQGEVDPLVGFHAGLGWAILYASWDSLVLPPFMVEGMTGYWDEENQIWNAGQRLPGFLNLFDAGIRIIIKPIVAFLEVGMNNIYVYKQGTEDARGLGANLRIGLGLKFGWWGISATGTSVFPTFDNLVGTLKGLVAESTRAWALQQLTAGLVPSLMAVIYF